MADASDDNLEIVSSEGSLEISNTEHFKMTTLGQTQMPATNKSASSIGNDVSLDEKSQVSHHSSSAAMLPVIVLVVTAIIIMIAVGGFAAVLVMNKSAITEEKLNCEDFQSRKSGETLYLGFRELSNEDIAFCHSKSCSFDVTQCERFCPLSFALDEADCPSSCECAVEGLMQGDILFDESDIATILRDYGFSDVNDFSLSRKIDVVEWENTINYILEDDLDKDQRSAWEQAINQLQLKTCLKFQEWDKTSPDYIQILKTQKSVCTSFLGRKGGRQRVVLGDCFTKKHIQHIVMHVLGFGHEHTRYDRDSQIEIQEINIVDQHRMKFHNFQLKPIQPHSTEFDSRSVTMFGGYSFSKEGGRYPTILDVDTKQVLLTHDVTEFSRNDIQDILDYYCNEKAQGTKYSWTDWGNWGNCDKTCGSATRTRYRQCKDTSDRVSKECPGENAMSLPCKDISCPQSTVLQITWSPWGPCSKTCGSGVKYRERQCLNWPSISMAGCTGAIMGDFCNTQSCSGIETYYRYDQWTSWSECTKTCGFGMAIRSRVCRKLIGIPTDYRNCRLDAKQQEAKACISSCTRKGRSGDEWSMNSATSLLLEEPKWFVRSESQLLPLLCDVRTESHWLYGDFNGDKKNDILCIDEHQKAKIVLAGGSSQLFNVSWNGNLDMCLLKQVYAGYFDGDMTTDVLCIAVVNGKRVILIFPVLSGKLRLPVNVGHICTEDRWLLYIADMNGDGRDDLVCRDKTGHPNKFSEIHFNIIN